jgi:hypothetical protein
MWTLQKTEAVQQEMPGMWDVDSLKPTQLHDLCQIGRIEAEANKLEALTRQRAREVARKYPIRRAQ